MHTPLGPVAPTSSLRRLPLAAWFVLLVGAATTLVGCSSAGLPGGGGGDDLGGDLGGADLALPPDLAPGAVCGGFHGTGCAPRQFCDIPYDCGFADGSGTCQPIPDLCPAVNDPVCGCDGKQYNNACEAHRAGVGVHYDGVCGCGSCAKGRYCSDCFGKPACLPKGAIC